MVCPFANHFLAKNFAIVAKSDKRYPQIFHCSIVIKAFQGYLYLVAIYRYTYINSPIQLMIIIIFITLKYATARLCAIAKNSISFVLDPKVHLA